MVELLTTATAERVQKIAQKLGNVYGFNTYPPEQYLSAYRDEDLHPLLVLSLGREDANRMIFVGCTDRSESGNILVAIYPHPYTRMADLGIRYEQFVAALRQQFTPQTDASTSKTPSESAAKSQRGPSEHDRIRTTLMTWAKESGKCRSYGDAATQLGIDVDTRRNHELSGWLYTEEEIIAHGGYEELWLMYTSTHRKS